MPLRRIGGSRGMEAAQRNAATLRRRGIEPNLAIRFRAGEISHDQLVELAAQRRAAAERAAVQAPRAAVAASRGSGPSPIVLFETVIEGVAIKLTAQRGR